VAVSRITTLHRKAVDHGRKRQNWSDRSSSSTTDLFTPRFSLPITLHPHQHSSPFLLVPNFRPNYVVMAPSLQLLIDYVLNEVALCGNQGVYSSSLRPTFHHPGDACHRLAPKYKCGCTSLCFCNFHTQLMKPCPKFDCRCYIR
jgi:hypothetical protein